MELEGDKQLLDNKIEIKENTSFEFKVKVESNYNGYEWYVDGVLKSTQEKFIFTNPRGIYEVVVIVTDSKDNKRSWRCRVTVLR